MAGVLTLDQRVAIVRAVMPELHDRQDYRLTWECLQVEEVLRPGGKLVPPDSAKEEQIRKLAKELSK